MPFVPSETRRLIAAVWCATAFAGCDELSQTPRAPQREAPLGPRLVLPPSTMVMSSAEVLEATRSSIVIIESLDRRRHVVAQGSGVVVARNTVITAWPLISRAHAVRVRVDGLSKPAVVAAVLPGIALARLEVNVDRPVDLGRDAPPPPGRVVFSVGAAQGASASVVEGIASGLRVGAKDEIDHIETTAVTPSGYTGGGLFEAHGQLIGIMASTRAGIDHSLAVPVRHVKDLLALPKGTLPKVAESPLRRLPAADRLWLVNYMAGIAREDKPLTGLGLDRVNALLDRLEPLVGAELEWVKAELGMSVLTRERLFWEDAIEARAFGRPVRSARRAAAERDLLAQGLLTQAEIADADARLTAIAEHQPFDLPGARVDATERFIAQMIGRIDEAKRRIETQLWNERTR
jgi:hypothetical protein